MEKYPVPKHTVYYKGAPRWKGPFGWHVMPVGSSPGRLEIYPCKWVPRIFGLRKFSNKITWNHEASHLWGIKGCWKPWCLVFEAMIWNEKWKDIWWERILSAIFGLFNGYRLCSNHRDYLRRAIRKIK